MIKFYKIFLLAGSMVFMASCVNKQQNAENIMDDYTYAPCQEETTIVVYDDEGAYQVPGCMDYTPQIYDYTEHSMELVQLNEQEKLALVENGDDEEEINPDDVEGEFPDVVDNKYHKNQVVMQNLQTRVLAYCRGDENEIDECIKRLECAGYTLLKNVPTMTAKYDFLKKGSYPTRRWRNGESVPRW